MYRLITQDGETVRLDPSEKSAIRAGQRLAETRGEPLRLAGVYEAPTTARTVIAPTGERREPEAGELVADWGLPGDDCAEA